MSPDAEERLSNSEYAIQLVRNRVDELQTAAAEKKKPWYRQTPSLPSLLALLLSVSTAIYSGIQGHKQDVQKKQESLRGIISALIDLAGENQVRLGSAEAQKLSTQEREFISGMLNNKRMILAEAADNLVRDIPNDISSSEYMIFANDKLTNGGAAKAEEYFRKAVAVSHDPLAKMIALRNLAVFYAQRGPFQNISEARKTFQAATDLLPGEPRDDATAYTLGFTWEMWGTAEYMNNFPEEAQHKIANARKYYNNLSKENPTRQSALLFLDTHMQRFNGAPSTRPSNNTAPPTASP
jgi:tetratricopeptide (TPR) repeat protein